ncbi:MAG: response regulator [Nitrospira sp.]|nr:response regulator [Nitrospira sp.]MBX3349074.1 response regulator [Nitrospira sp.]MCW5793935.1 response regulator [Nitrospira sp.]
MSLLDIDLPGEGGLLILDRLKTNYGRSKMSVFVMTTETSPGLESKARPQGISTFFQKPIQKEALIDALRRLLAKPTIL